mmetsp:Transcript_39325/g.113805  ORF Transcript_39325/g.113805 Transcript_39325/m.113805 type:complete len:201 (-) Transcript_39325:99-701(-)
MHALQALIHHDGTHGVAVPYCAHAVRKGLHPVVHLVDHLVEVVPALPRDRPHVGVALRLDLAPSLGRVGGARAEFRGEEQDALGRRILFRGHDVRKHVVRRVFPSRRLRFRGQRLRGIPKPQWLPGLAHFVRGVPEWVRKGCVLVCGPWSAPAHVIEDLPLVLVLVQPLIDRQPIRDATVYPISNVVGDPLTFRSRLHHV